MQIVCPFYFFNWEELYSFIIPNKKIIYDIIYINNTTLDIVRVSPKLLLFIIIEEIIAVKTTIMLVNRIVPKPFLKFEKVSFKLYIKLS